MIPEFVNPDLTDRMAAVDARLRKEPEEEEEDDEEEDNEDTDDDEEDDGNSDGYSE